MVGKVCTTDGFLCCIVIKTSQILQSCLVTELVFILWTGKRTSFRDLQQLLGLPALLSSLLGQEPGTGSFNPKELQTMGEGSPFPLLLVHVLGTHHPTRNPPASAGNGGWFGGTELGMRLVAGVEASRDFIAEVNSEQPGLSKLQVRFLLGLAWLGR